MACRFVAQTVQHAAQQLPENMPYWAFRFGADGKPWNSAYDNGVIGYRLRSNDCTE